MQFVEGRRGVVAGGGGGGGCMVTVAGELPAAAYERVRRLATGNAVVVFSHSGCCMCHVAKRLLLGLGVGPVVYEVDELKWGPEVQAVLYQLAGNRHQPPVPAVFVGGKFLGGLDTLMSRHIDGTLVPLLKQAGALWL